jgi:hypothetical protein
MTSSASRVGGAGVVESDGGAGSAGIAGTEILDDLISRAGVGEGDGMAGSALAGTPRISARAAGEADARRFEWRCFCRELENSAWSLLPNFNTLTRCDYELGGGPSPQSLRLRLEVREQGSQEQAKAKATPKLKPPTS